MVNVLLLETGNEGALIHPLELSEKDTNQTFEPIKTFDMISP
jgi:hypothetical protein